MYQKKKQLRIRTPEGISFALEPASPLMRFFAWSIDTLLVIGISLLLQQLFFNHLIKVAPDLGTGLYLLVTTALYLCYAMCLEWFWHGRTLGKRLFRLRVMDSKGFHLQASQVVIRNLLRVIDSLPLFYLVGGAASFFSPLYQRLGDRVANTVVIKLPKFSSPDLTGIGEQKFNSLRAYPHLVARLRQAVTPAEADIGLQALRRRDTLDDQERTAFFDQLTDHFKAKCTFPEEAVHACSSEQYVRNVVEVLYESGQSEKK
ncbi:MAG: RDD family protein [Candidatus Electrothrix scaldis]|nr:MAG: RDD family protein [Candidatus Electrothrix sp. GW3-3]